ncbi:MAG TPA: HU family DNA-binding protein [Patescibacteria group bacterium]|nr:HU family DNA-binding protein [Patescibacteria group bacterium]
MKKQQLIEKLANEMNTDSDNAGKWVDAVLEGIFQSLKRREKVTLPGFGTFYIDGRSSGTVFKFNPSQRMRSMLGWSSTYNDSD